MIKRMWGMVVRWIKLNLMQYYDPYFKTKDGMHYAKMPNGIIVRLENKRRLKRKKKLNELREFFK